MSERNSMSVSDLSDSRELYEAQKRLIEAEAEVARLKTLMGKAHHVLEYDSDERKRALAKATIPFLEKGESAAKAEQWARGSFNYEQELLRLAKAHRIASDIKFEYEGAKIAVEVARTMVSSEKTLASL